MFFKKQKINRFNKISLLIAITQRKLVYFEHLNNMKNKLQLIINEFCLKIINLLLNNINYQQCFENNRILSNNNINLIIVLDIYIIEKSLNLKVVDLNIMTKETDMLLINEDDLTQSNDIIIFRIIENHKDAAYYNKCLVYNTLNRNQYPIDIEKVDKQMMDEIECKLK